MIYYARRQQNIQQTRQKHKEEHNTQKDKKVHKLNYKNTNECTVVSFTPLLRVASHFIQRSRCTHYKRLGQKPIYDLSQYVMYWFVAGSTWLSVLSSTADTLSSLCVRTSATAIGPTSVGASCYRSSLSNVPASSPPFVLFLPWNSTSSLHEPYPRKCAAENRSKRWVFNNCI